VDSLYLDNNIDILFWNYRGYGFSKGSTDFNNICEDVLCVYDHMSQNYNYNNIAVHGLSIGGIPSCFLAKNRKIKLLIADRTFGSVLDFLNSFRYINKGLFYLATILRVPLVDNASNYIEVWIFFKDGKKARAVCNLTFK
jgi:predicted alpha/beta-fold hydrolase